MGYPERLLSDGEVIETQFRPHWSGVVREGLLILAGVAAAVVTAIFGWPAWVYLVILGLVIVFVTRVPTELAIVLFSIAFFGQQSWSTLVMIVPTDLFPRRVVASVAGLVGFGGAMGGVVFNLIAGQLLDSGLGYGVVFSIVGTFHVIAFCIILMTIRNIGPLLEADS